MAFNTEQLIAAGKNSIDLYLKNNPIDQVAVERPFLRRLMAEKKAAPGALQYIVENLRTNYGSAFKWFNGAALVSYNSRTVNELVKFPWRSAHDGLALNEDQLAQNGITVVDSGTPAMATDREKVALSNLFEEQMAALRLGFEESLSKSLLKYDAADTDSIEGLDVLVSLTPTTGTVGGLNRANALYWRNHVDTSLNFTAAGNAIDRMELMWRNCSRNGGRPNMIIAGSNFIDNLRWYMAKGYGVGNFNWSGDTERLMEVGTRQINFHGVGIEWMPEFFDLDDVSVTQKWERRAYMLNMNHIKLRPLAGHDMVTRKPPRLATKYEWYWAVTWRGALTMNRANCHGVMYAGTQQIT